MEAQSALFEAENARPTWNQIEQRHPNQTLVTADVDGDGNLQVHSRGVMHVALALPKSEALALGRWLVETFDDRISAEVTK
jgi:hypothetical protein